MFDHLRNVLTAGKLERVVICAKIQVLLRGLVLHEQLLKLVEESIVDLECTVGIRSITEALGRVVCFEVPRQVIEL